MKITKANFLSLVKESASAAVQKGEQISYDLEDAGTRQYVSNLLTKVKEAAGADTNWDDLFKWTTEDFCTTLTDVNFPEVAESSSELDITEAEAKDLAGKAADDANSLQSLMNSFNDADSLVKELDLVTESSESVEETEETEDAKPEDTEEVAESTVAETEETEDAKPEDTEEVAESTETETEETDDTAPEGTEEVAESADETVEETDDTAPEGTEEVAESTETETEETEETAPEGTEEVAESTETESDETDDAAPEGTEEVAESTETETIDSIFKVVTETVDESDWSEVDKGAIKTQLREAKESNVEGIDDIIKEVYAVVGDVEDPATWKYPHHVVTESGEVLLNKAGLDIASSYVSTRFTGQADLQKAAAQSLSVHYDAIGVDVPPTIARVAESSSDVHMITLEILDNNGDILTIDNTDGDAAVGICVAESIANSLHNTGLVQVSEPTIIRIDSDQLNHMTDYMKNFVGTLMGEEVTSPVEESSVDTSELDQKIDELSGQLDLYKKKVDTLHSLLDGSPLEGVAESVVSADQVESVEALKSVADSIGVNRLITTRKQAEVDEAEDKAVTESSAGLDSLVALSNLVSTLTEDNSKADEEPEDPKNEPNLNRLTNFV